MFMPIVLAALASTSFMTLFSYLVATLAKKEFSEPFLLNKFLSRRLRTDLDINRSLYGWMIHYAVGGLFVSVYHLLWLKGFLPVAGNDLVLGFASGLIGAGGWLLVRKIDPGMNELWNRSFYLQLILAHIIFAIVASATYHSQAARKLLLFSVCE